jgi:hypothetical protein
MSLRASALHLIPPAVNVLFPFPFPGAGLLNTYKSLFSLDDSLAEIQTRDALFDYLREVSKQARLIQPLSSAYFVEETGQLKVVSGVCTASTRSVFLALNSPEM